MVCTLTKGKKLYFPLNTSEWLFVCNNSLNTSQQLFSHVGTGLPGLNLY